MSAPVAPAPLAARWLAAVAPSLPAAARVELERGHVNARVVREALADIASKRPVAVLPSRSEAAAAWQWLQRNAAREAAA